MAKSKKEDNKKKETKKQPERIRITHNKKILWWIAILAVLLVILILLIRTYPKVKECSTDSDCIKQRISCCSCQMGGQEVCMSKQNASSYKDKISNCNGVLCTAVYNCRKTSCVCKKGVCVEE